MKTILKKRVNERCEEDHGQLMVLLKKIRFFQERKKLNLDLRELSAQLKLEKFRAMETIIEYGEKNADKFYIIISGVVSVSIPNMQNIPNWFDKYAEYQKLKEWKQKAMSSKIAVAKVERK
jgi:signal-transduction protein with cAMP-binding, CBS, and nucleotidyltransferase domain